MGKIWSKDAEREQLRKIRELIEETEIGSYIRMSFSGICEMCAQNIENDFADNMPELLENRDEEIRQLRQKIVNSDAKHGETILRLEHERDCLADQLKAKDAEIQKLDHMLHARETECAKLESERDVMVECHDGLAEMVDKYEQEIMRLKAEVYDLRKWGESPVVPGDNSLRTEGE